MAAAGFADPVRSSPETMEESIITLPVLANGVIALGDLWDCRSLTCPGTILDAPLTATYAEYHPMRALDYQLRRISNTADKVKELHISAELKLEAMGGKIKVEGSASYDAEEVSNFNEEELHCEYLLYAHKLRLRPNVKEIFNKDMVDKITGSNPTVAATHYVQEVLIGAHVLATLKYQEKITKDNWNIKGSFDGKAEFGPVSVELKLSLEMLDTDEAEHYETSISLKASPPLTKTPTTVAEMFKEIEKIDQIVANEQHYEGLFPGRKLQGVPLSFKLAPLSQLFDEKLIGYYEIMKQEILDAFLDMICTFQDFQGQDYLKHLIIQQYSALVVILRDPYNELTKAVTAREITLMEDSKKLKTESFILFGKYKEGEVTEEELNELIQENDKIFNLVVIYEEVYKFVEEGKGLLTAIHTGDTYSAAEGKVDEDGDELTTRVQFFTNRQDLDDWWSQERRIKLLLETRHESGDGRSGSTSGTFIKLFDMSCTLIEKFNVEVGVALPNISNSYSLTMKIGSKEIAYSKGSELQFMLEALGIAIDKGELMSTLFHTTNNALSGIYQPYSLHDLPSLINIMKQYLSPNFVICESYIQLLEQVALKPELWTFVLPLEASHTASDSVRFFRQLRLDFQTKQPALAHQWLVGKFNSSSHDGPLLLVFRHGQLQAVCLDHMDILILFRQLQALKKTAEAGNGTRTLLKLNNSGSGSSSRSSMYDTTTYAELEPISIHAIRPQCFYPERANFILPLIENLVIHQHQTYLYDPVTQLPSFPATMPLHLVEAIEIGRVVCSRREVRVLSAVTRHVISKSADGLNFEDEVLRPNQSKYGWRPNEKQFLTTGARWAWSDLSVQIDVFISKLDSSLGSIQSAVKELQALVKEVEYVEPPPEPEEPDPPEKAVVAVEGSGDMEGHRRLRMLEARKLEDAVIKERLEKIIGFILTAPDGSGFERLRDELEKFENSAPTIRLYASLNALQVYYSEELSSEDYYYLTILKFLVDNLALESNTIKPLFQLLLQKYTDRLLEGDNGNNGSASPAAAVGKWRKRLTTSSPAVAAPPLITDEDFPGLPRLLRNSVTDSNFYRTLTLLVKSASGPPMFKVQQELYNQASIINVETMKAFLENVYQWNFNQQMIKDIWLNPKFLHWIRQGLENESLLETIKYRICVNEDYDEEDPGGSGGAQFIIPRWLPQDVKERLKPLFYSVAILDYPWNQSWTDVESVVQVFQAIATRQLLPVKFMKIFQQLMTTNEGLRVQLEDEYKILYFWNANEEYFDEPWSLRIVLVALNILMKSKEEEEQALSKEELHHLTLPSSKGMAMAAATGEQGGGGGAGMWSKSRPGKRELEDWNIEKPEEEPESKPISVNRLWRHLAPSDLKVPVITQRVWNIIDHLPTRTFIQNEHQLPYTLQKLSTYLLSAFLRMSNATDLAETSKVASFLNYISWAERQPGPRPGYIEFLDSDEEEYEHVKKFLLTRGDLLTAICSNLADPLLTLDFCRILLEGVGTRVALPIIVPDISTNEGNGGKSLLPLLQQIYILSNSNRTATAATISRSRDSEFLSSTGGSSGGGGWRPLLNNLSRFITVIRVGSPSGGVGGNSSIGKSTILNQHVMSNENFFSCRLESGSENGPPVQRSGLVEFTRLTRFTCHTSFWETFGFSLESPTSSSSSQSSDVYLANLHGDSLDFGNVLKVLDNYTSSYIVLWRANNWTDLKNKKKLLTELIGNRTHVLNMIVDPDETILEQVYDSQNILLTSQLLDPSTPAKLYNVFKEALKYNGRLQDVQDGSIEHFDYISIKTDESTALLSYVQEHTVSTIRQLFQQVQLTLRACSTEQEYKDAVAALLAESPILYAACTHFIKILNLPLTSRFEALSHLLLQLEQLSQPLRQRYVERILKLEAELLDYVRSAKESNGRVALDLEYIKYVQNEIKGIRSIRDTMSLDVKEFWKQLDFIIPLHVPHVQSHYYDTYVQLIKMSWSVQLMDGDEGEAAASNPELYHSFRLKPIDHIFTQHFPPATRVFVISILGLRSSGKSTLLNSIFGSSAGSFPVGMAGCTRGLMARVHKLSPSLSQQLKLDVILVIDSEGVGAAESYLDDSADIYERELATFLLGISHLTLVHVVDGRSGRGYDDELSSILEIGLTTLATMDGLRPTRDADLLFVYEPQLEEDVPEQSSVIRAEEEPPPFLESFKVSLDRLLQFTSANENALLLGVKTTMSTVADLIKQRVRHDELIFNTSSYGGAPGGLYNQILNICSQSTEQRITIGDWYEFKTEFQKQIKSIGSQQQALLTSPTTVENLPRAIYPLHYKNLADLQASSNILRGIRQVKYLIDTAYRYHVGIVEEGIEERLGKLYYNDEDLKPYPPTPVAYDVCKSKALVMAGELDKQMAFLWKTINTCDVNSTGGGGGMAGRSKRWRNDEPPSSDSCKDCLDAFTARESLIAEIQTSGLIKMKRQLELIDDLLNYQQQVRDTAWSRCTQKVFSTQLRYRCVPEMIPAPPDSKDSKDQQEGEGDGQGQEIMQDFDEKSLGIFVSNKVTVIPAWRLIQEEALQEYTRMPPSFKERIEGINWFEKLELPDLESKQAFDLGYYNQSSAIDSSALSERKSTRLTWIQNDWILAKIHDLPAIITTEFDSNYFLLGMIRQLQNKMHELLLNFEVYCEQKLEINFCWEVHLVALLYFTKCMIESQLSWNENERNPNHPLHVWGKIKELGYSNSSLMVVDRAGGGEGSKVASPKGGASEQEQIGAVAPPVSTSSPAVTPPTGLPATTATKTPSSRHGGWVRR